MTEMDYVAATTPRLSQIGMAWWDFTPFCFWDHELDSTTLTHELDLKILIRLEQSVFYSLTFSCCLIFTEFTDASID